MNHTNPQEKESKSAEEIKDQLFIKIKGLPIIEFDRNALAEDVFEVDFGGSYKIQITNENGQFVITNAMNGYGDNCYEQFKGEQVSFMTYYDYALSISNENAQSQPAPALPVPDAAKEAAVDANNKKK